MDVEEICLEARHLPRPEQGELIGRLLEEFGSSDYDVSDKEVGLRIVETENGTVADISHTQLLDGLDHLRNS
jgi:hypothetical protein